VSTTRDTLTRREPDSVLARMFGGATHLPAAAVDQEGRYLLDRSPEAFAAVLTYLRCGKLDRDDVERRRELLLEEAHYWNLPGLLSLLSQQQPDFPDRGSFVRFSLAGTFRQEAWVGVRFNGLDLSSLVLEGMGPFLRCDFSNCNLSNCRAEKVLFSGSVFDGATIDNAALSGAAFNACSMPDCSFRGAVMTHGIFQRAQMPRCNFAGAKLEHAHMQDAVLRGCNFAKADLSSTHFGESDCRGAVIPWSELGQAPFFRGVWVTEAEYAAIARPDKEALKLRVIAVEESESMRELRQMVRVTDFVAFVLGQDTFMAGAAELYCAEALAIIEKLSVRFSHTTVDVIGKSQLLDDLFLLTGTRSWPKIFFRGEFVGGLEALKARLPTLN
jgi:uncharacterized protein YjbI with pentapeptide repeats/glutaredoxin-related protein